MTTKGTDSANPYFFSGQDTNGEPHIDCGRGLTKREYIAIAAMQGMLASGAMFTNTGDFCMTRAKATAELAAQHADALIEALNEANQ